MAAAEVHSLSDRKGRYVPINCSALGEGLIESELFGHERGAFTSAVDRHLGVFEQANNGTVFLDEVTEMKPELQAKLLRVLEDQHVTRLGGRDRIPINVRIIAANNRSPLDAVAQGHLRQGLYYRLKVFQIVIPPRRDRVEDLEDLVPHFIEGINRDEGTEVDGIDCECLAALRTYFWPGNVRELRNVIHQAMISRERGLTTVAILPDDLCQPGHKVEQFVARIGSTLRSAEHEFILKTLEAAGYNRTRAAEILGISRRRFYDLLHKDGFTPRERWPGRNRRT